jgi:hypothetical protein
MVTATARGISHQVLEHMLRQIEATPAQDWPFSHIYLDDVFPSDLYDDILSLLPEPEAYEGSANRYRGEGNLGYVRSLFELTPGSLGDLPETQRELWAGIAAALTAPELKRAIYAKLAKDLAYRYRVPESDVDRLAGYSRPTLYRETEGFEIPPHPDTRKKVVTMHLYLPANRSQIGLGTALYRRKRPAWPFGDWRRRFEKVKQFAFLPNSGYAFVVNNTVAKRSWHGRERLPTGSCIRNTLLNAFYEIPRDDFHGDGARAEVSARGWTGPG